MYSADGIRTEIVHHNTNCVLMNKIGQYKISVNLKKKFANNLTTFSQIYFFICSCLCNN